MTSKAQKKNGWLIPTPITGYPLVCVKLQIPNAREYIAAVTGAIYELTKWWNWEKSYLPGDTRAVQASSYMMESINAMTIDDCCTIQYRYLDCDLLEFSLDGENWQTVADFSDCFVALHPATTARNIIMPSQENVVALTIQQLPGSSADIERWYRENGALAATLDGTGDWIYDGVLYGYSKTVGGRWALGRNIDSKIYLDLKGHGGHNQINFWSGFSGNQLFTIETPYFDPTRMKLYGTGYMSYGMTLRDTGEVGFGKDTPLAKQHIKVANSAQRGQIIELVAAQEYNAEEVQDQSGSMLSGRDWLGRHILAEDSGLPSDPDAKRGTLVYATESGRIWRATETTTPNVAEWHNLWSSQDGEVIASIVYETDPDATEGVVVMQPNQQLAVSFPGKAQSTLDAYGGIGLHKKRARPTVGNFDEITLLLNKADDWIMLPWELAVGDFVTIIDCVGWVSHQTLNMIEQGYTGLGTDYFDGSASTTADNNYLLAGEPIMSLVLQVNAVETPYQRDLYGITELIASAEISRVWEAEPRGVLCLNTPDILTGSLYGALQIRVRLLAGAVTASCGLSDFETGLHGWAFKPIGVEPTFYYNVTEQLEMWSAEYQSGVGFKTTLYTDEVPNHGETSGLIIYAFLDAAVDINTIDIDYEIIDNDHDFYIHYSLYDGVDWTSFSQQSITQGVGTHTHTIMLSNNSTEGIAVVLKTLRVAGNPNTSDALISSITINCEA